MKEAMKSSVRGLILGFSFWGALFSSPFLVGPWELLARLFTQNEWFVLLLMILSHATFSFFSVYFLYKLALRRGGKKFRDQVGRLTLISFFGIDSLYKTFKRRYLMKAKCLLSMVLGILMFGMLVGCMKPNQKQIDEDSVNYVLGEIIYFQDPQTDLCFAYQSTGGYGGPALAHVPCDSVPKELLVVVAEQK